MYLKEFNLDLPYVLDDETIEFIMKKQNCEYNEATKLDYALNWKWKRRSFSLETRCITAMYERLFGKYNTKDCWKVLIECVENITDERIVNVSGVCSVPIQFSLNDFNEKNELEKKKTTLRMLMEGIEKLALRNNWEVDPFREIALQIEALDYVNEWTWKKSVKSPNKKYNARVICHHNVDSMDIFLSILQRDGTQVFLEKVISEQPDEFAYDRHLGELTWVSDFEVALINKTGTEKFYATLEH
ncbi:hypothetical protein E2R58_08295 [Paenibacillus amylolyticus]|uniref:hypothetical protein n=1 Tax=Paenibacillus amylolyticus TaxID=1451 RepID=UPI00105A0412|nr:hypothetical protein [Paenibacillus amylolyticus]TDL69176.1 hypothetical protein E2R58_08295 [Paenibacillus amylolyticus]